MTVDWAKRHQPFPLPFYVAYVPHWFVVDLAILLIIACSAALAYMALCGGGRS